MSVRSLHASAVRAEDTIQVPQMAESITEGTLKQWNKKKGDFVEADEEIAVIETDKVSRCSREWRGVGGRRVLCRPCLLASGGSVYAGWLR